MRLCESIDGVVESLLRDVPQVHQEGEAALRIERRRADARQLPTPARPHKLYRAALVAVRLLVDDAQQRIDVTPSLAVVVNKPRAPRRE